MIYSYHSAFFVKFREFRHLSFHKRFIFRTLENAEISSLKSENVEKMPSVPMIRTDWWKCINNTLQSWYDRAEQVKHPSTLISIKCILSEFRHQHKWMKPLNGQFFSSLLKTIAVFCRIWRNWVSNCSKKKTISRILTKTRHYILILMWIVSIYRITHSQFFVPFGYYEHLYIHLKDACMAYELRVLWLNQLRQIDPYWIS